jgi:hypothetical protein
MRNPVLNIILLTSVFVFISFAQPKLEIVGGDTYDWNTVTPEQSPLSAKIKLKNTGNQILFISNVRPTCGCTIVNLENNEIQPGAETTLNVKLNFSTMPGQLVKTVFILSNDPKNPTTNLYLKAKVHVDLELSPAPYFLFDDMQVGKEANSKVRLINHTNKKIVFSDITMKPESVSVNLSKELVLKPEEGYDIIIHVKPEKRGYLGCQLTMKTSNPKYPLLEISGSSVVSDSVNTNSVPK